MFGSIFAIRPAVPPRCTQPARGDDAHRYVPGLHSWKSSWHATKRSISPHEYAESTRTTGATKRPPPSRPGTLPPGTGPRKRSATSRAARTRRRSRPWQRPTSLARCRRLSAPWSQGSRLRVACCRARSAGKCRVASMVAWRPSTLGRSLSSLQRVVRNATSPARSRICRAMFNTHLSAGATDGASSMGAVSSGAAAGTPGTAPRTWPSPRRRCGGLLRCL